MQGSGSICGATSLLDPREFADSGIIALDHMLQAGETTASVVRRLVDECVISKKYAEQAVLHANVFPGTHSPIVESDKAAERADGKRVTNFANAHAKLDRAAMGLEELSEHEREFRYLDERRQS